MPFMFFPQLFVEVDPLDLFRLLSITVFLYGDSREQ